MTKKYYKVFYKDSIQECLQYEKSFYSSRYCFYEKIIDILLYPEYLTNNRAVPDNFNKNKKPVVCEIKLLGKMTKDNWNNFANKIEILRELSKEEVNKIVKKEINYLLKEKNNEELSLNSFDVDFFEKILLIREDGIQINFEDIREKWKIEVNNNCIIKASHCKIKANNNCIIKTYHFSSIESGNSCIINTNEGCSINTGFNCLINSGCVCNIKTKNNCRITGVGIGSILDIGENSIINAFYNKLYNVSKIKTGKLSTIILHDTENNEKILREGIEYKANELIELKI